MTTPDAPRSQEPVEVDPRTLPPPVGPPIERSGWSPGPYPHQPSFGPPPYGPPPLLPVPAWAKPKAPVLPAEAVEYQHLLRTPRQRWWKPLLTLLVFVVVAVLVINVGALFLFLVGLAQGVPNPVDYLIQVTDVEGQALGPLAFGFVNFSLIALIPAAMFARWLVYRQRPGFLTSVAGRFRWGWMARCLACTLPVWAVYIGLSTVFTGTPEARPAYWGVLIALVVLTTPLQCAGEEYAFRGMVMQTVGSWFRRPIVALVAGAIPAFGLFAAAHGSPDPLILLQFSIFAASCVIVTWRTGGLEGAIAMHLSNNVLLMLVSILYGGWGNAFVSGDTKGSLVGVLIEVVVDGVAVTLILWQARRAKLSRTFAPAPTVPALVPPVPAPQPT